MKASVILSTYNSPLWLEKVLWGYTRQSHRDFEIILADDGSTDHTHDLVTRMRQQTDLKVVHVWHEDSGFRKCTILNKAITQCQYDYVIFSDGDCIPHVDFVATHVKQAKSRHYLSGSYFKLPMQTSQAIDRESILSGACFEPQWLYRNGLPRNSKTTKFACPKSLAWLFNHLTPVKCNLKGSNASAWKCDIIAVNGFDERMPWGGEDREFGVRLLNAGIKAKHVRFNAFLLHLDHARGYVDPEQVKKNKALRIYNEKHKITRTDYGIDRVRPEQFELR